MEVREIGTTGVSVTREAMSPEIIMGFTSECETAFSDPEFAPYDLMMQGIISPDQARFTTVLDLRFSDYPALRRVVNFCGLTNVRANVVVTRLMPGEATDYRTTAFDQGLHMIPATEGEILQISSNNFDGEEVGPYFSGGYVELALHTGDIVKFDRDLIRYKQANTSSFITYSLFVTHDAQ